LINRNSNLNNIRQEVIEDYNDSLINRNSNLNSIRERVIEDYNDSLINRNSNLNNIRQGVIEDFNNTVKLRRQTGANFGEWARQQSQGAFDRIDNNLGFPAIDREGVSRSAIGGFAGNDFDNFYAET
jgi:hypothetical protein